MTDAVLRHFGVTSADRIGHGGDATVYALSGERVLRVLHRKPHDITHFAPFYDELAHDVGARDRGRMTVAQRLCRYEGALRSAPTRDAVPYSIARVRYHALAGLR